MIVQKLGVPPVYCLHSLEILRGFILSAAEAVCAITPNAKIVVAYARRLRTERIIFLPCYCHRFFGRRTWAEATDGTRVRVSRSTLREVFS